MSDNPPDKNESTSASRSAGRVVSAVVALVSLGSAGYLANVGLDAAVATTAPALIRDHAPALVGLPFLVALTTALVCGARALETRSHFEILGLRADGAGATILGWVLVFSALVVALRALW